MSFFIISSMTLSTCCCRWYRTVLCGSATGLMLVSMWSFIWCDFNCLHYNHYVHVFAEFSVPDHQALIHGPFYFYVLFIMTHLFAIVAFIFLSLAEIEMLCYWGIYHESTEVTCFWIGCILLIDIPFGLLL